MATTSTTKERPILFSGEMVRAIFAGRKTQTRRQMKPQPRIDSGSLTWGRTTDAWVGWARETEYAGNPHPNWLNECPHGQRGERLWVRETFMIADGEIAYAATDQPLVGCDRWRPSIHMPRWASRLTLEITDVRIERLQDIGEADAQAEGAQRPVLSSDTMPGMAPPFNRVHPMTGHYVDGFRALWESINGAGSWQGNAWVWVVSFKLI